jgi:hypothetical protein
VAKSFCDPEEASGGRFLTLFGDLPQRINLPQNFPPVGFSVTLQTLASAPKMPYSFSRSVTPNPKKYVTPGAANYNQSQGAYATKANHLVRG